MGIIGHSGDEAGRGGSDGVSVHEPVLLAEVLEALDLGPGLTVLDGTVGAGGHARAIAAAIGPDGFLVGLDRDAAVLTRARESLAEGVGDAAGRVRIRLFQSCFSRIRAVLDELELPHCDRVLLDVGVSSLQIDDPERGFSFMQDGPLDMRMDRSASPTAAEFLARVSERELARVLREYGEERHWRRIARAIVEARGKRGGLRRTSELVDAVVGALPPGARRQQRIHPATRAFQAIRIAVNDELGRLERGLEAANDALVEGGRLAVIAFHSLEDRIVKRFVRERMEPLVRKPIRPTDAECRRNPRARSARLRCGIKRPAA